MMRLLVLLAALAAASAPGAGPGTVIRCSLAPDGQEFSRVLVQIGADRKVEFYVWKVVHREMLAAIAFNFAISGSLPTGFLLVNLVLALRGSSRPPPVALF